MTCYTRNLTASYSTQCCAIYVFRLIIKVVFLYCILRPTSLDHEDNDIVYLNYGEYDFDYVDTGLDIHQITKREVVSGDDGTSGLLKVPIVGNKLVAK